MGTFDFALTISALTVFLQGTLSFFSPCVLPLVPLYIGYLSGGARQVEADGTIRYRRGRVMGNTAAFVAGVSFAFFLLGMGFTAAGQFFSRYQDVIAKVGGVLIILFGLYQLGVFGASRFLSTERRLPFRLDKAAMSPLTALVLGFTFSFAWTPCVGPALTSVLLMAGSSSSAAKGFLLIGVYTLGVHPPLPGGGPLHRLAAGPLPPPSEGGALHGEGGRGADDPHGRHAPHRLDEPHVRRPLLPGN